MLDLYKLLHHRRYFDQIIDSDVEFIGRIHSVAFSEFHAELLRPLIEGKVIADLGCGQLPYIHAFSSSGLKEYYAFDLNRESLDIARRNYRGSFPLHLVQCGVKKVPLPADSIDAIVSSEVIEHLERPLEYLQEIHRICKTRGYLSISTPCISIYLYPHNFLGLLKNPFSVKQWWRQLNAHKDWQAALSWHPALRPAVLRSWVEKVGFKAIRHETRLWYYGTPLQPAWRFFKLLERTGVKTAGAIFSRYLKMTDQLLRTNIPILRWAGIRQFVLCQK
jgi:ubiquinone/menaquinone biosynthesis C-methylase UbiE